MAGKLRKYFLTMTQHSDLQLILSYNGAPKHAILQKSFL